MSVPLPTPIGIIASVLVWVFGLFSLIMTVCLFVMLTAALLIITTLPHPLFMLTITTVSLPAIIPILTLALGVGAVNHSYISYQPGCAEGSYYPECECRLTYCGLIVKGYGYSYKSDGHTYWFYDQSTGLGTSISVENSSDDWSGYLDPNCTAASHHHTSDAIFSAFRSCYTPCSSSSYSLPCPRGWGNRAGYDAYQSGCSYGSYYPDARMELRKEQLDQIVSSIHIRPAQVNRNQY